MASHLDLTCEHKKDVFPGRAIKHWHRLPLSWDIMKTRLEVTLSILVWVEPEDSQRCPRASATLGSRGDAWRLVVTVDPTSLNLVGPFAN